MSPSRALSMRVRLALVLATVIGVSLAALLWVTTTADPLRVVRLPEFRLPDEQTLFGKGPQRSLDTAISRPLFWPSRRPVAEVADNPTAEVASADGIQLLGVVVQGGVRMALLGTKGGVVRVRMKDLVLGWTVEQIKPEGVRLVNGQQKVELLVVPQRREGIHIEPVAPAKP
ncbi:hypothetical protein [Pseudomonas sp. RIT-PI-AD]|uniref:hypothetical protein n=1 Tax=Pseudomonas sp. RIT-PI-AD TaxID=3035294 RepID=UPI0021D991CD|nr:hypothetical protein [Pseudomonas sp. RIT-PI-AD]